MAISGLTYIQDFIDQPGSLFANLKDSVLWDNRMAARKTASFGVAYNYSQISYPYQPFPDSLTSIIEQIARVVGFTPNNCLLNYYPDGSSSMGFHSDQTDILVENTGVVIVSLGANRVLRFRRIGQKELVHDYQLPSGSLVFMTDEMQTEWQHAIPKDDSTSGRISLTFRQIKADLGE